MKAYVVMESYLSGYDEVLNVMAVCATNALAEKRATEFRAIAARKFDNSTYHVVEWDVEQE